MYLHGVRLTLLVIAVVSLAPLGLFGVSLGMSMVEGLVSVVGQALACALIGLSLLDLARSVRPALRLTGLRSRPWLEEPLQRSREPAARRFWLCGRAAGAGLSMDGAL